MRFTASLLGWTMDWSLSPDAAEDDPAAALNGGTLASTGTDVDISHTDTFMGFTNGREGCTDPEDGRLT